MVKICLILLYGYEEISNGTKATCYHTPTKKINMDLTIWTSRSSGYESTPFGTPHSVCNTILKCTSGLWQQTWNSGREEVQNQGSQE